MSKKEMLLVSDLLRLADPAIKTNPAWREYFCELVERCPRCNAEGVPLDEESRESRLKREISEELTHFLLSEKTDPDSVRVVVMYPEGQASLTIAVGAKK